MSERFAERFCLWSEREIPPQASLLLHDRIASFQVQTACERRVVSKAKTLYVRERRTPASSQLLLWSRTQYLTWTFKSKHFWKEYDQHENQDKCMREDNCPPHLPLQLTLTCYQQTWTPQPFWGQHQGVKHSHWSTTYFLLSGLAWGLLFFSYPWKSFQSSNN